jgi:exonuclease SbcD
MRIVHTGDFHVGPSRSRIDPDTGLNSRLVDRYQCARFAVADGLQRGGQLVLIAGDVFDHCRPTPSERRLAIQSLQPALEVGVPVVLLLGNHDAARSPAEKHALDLLRDMQGITVVDRPALLNVWAGADGVVVEPPEMATPDGRDLALQLAVLPYPNKQLLLADDEHRRLEPGLLNQVVREKMMDVALGLAAQRIEGIPCLLLGHFSVDLAQAGGQSRFMMLGGEWTLNLHDLQALDFDAILLGHIHKPQEWVDEQERATAYCGSPEAVSFGEEGEPKSYCIWDVKPGEVPLVERVATPHRTFMTLEAGAPMPPAEHLSGAIVRVRVPQAADVDMGQLRRDLEAAGVHEYQIETQRAEAVRRRAVEVSAETALDDALRAWLEQMPDLQPLTEQIIAEAMRIEAALREGGAE